MKIINAPIAHAKESNAIFDQIMGLADLVRGSFVELLKVKA